MNRLLRSFAVPAVASLALLACASATRAQVFTNRALFTAALTGTTTTETFTNAQTLAIGNNLYNGIGINLVGTSAGGNNISGGLYNGDIFTNITQITFSFASPVNAFGADFVSAASASGINLSIAGTTYSLGTILGTPGTGFFGVVSNTAFSTVTINSTAASPNEIFTLDNLTTSRVTGAAAPEPASLALMAIPVGAVIARRRRRN